MSLLSESSSLCVNIQCQSGHRKSFFQSDFPSVNRLAASAAHVAHCVIVLALAYAGAKYWLIFVLVLAISSDFFGLPGLLQVLMYVSVGLVDTREASLLAIRFCIWIVRYTKHAMPWCLSSLFQSSMCWSFNLFAYLRISLQPVSESHDSL